MPNKIQKKVAGVPNYLRDWLKTFKAKLTIICLIILFIVPIFNQNSYHLGIFIQFMIFTIFAASWDFLAGYVGQVSFGQSIFLGISGYVTAYFMVYFSLPWWISLICGSIMAVLFGLIIGIPALRLKGPYLSLGTLSMSLLLLQLFSMGTLAIWWEETFGTRLFGTDGISGVPPISYNPAIEYLVILVIMIISLLILTHLVKSNMGTIFKAIRDDETGTSASGINTTKYKIIAFMISGFFAGVAGSLYASHYRSVNPGVFQALYSFFAIMMAAIGGIATISGSAVGAFFFTFLTAILIAFGFENYSLLIFSLILMVVMRLAEHGIMQWLIEKLKDLWDILLGR